MVEEVVVDLVAATNAMRVGIEEGTRIAGEVEVRAEDEETTGVQRRGIGPRCEGTGKPIGLTLQIWRSLEMSLSHRSTSTREP